MILWQQLADNPVRKSLFARARLLIEVETKKQAPTRINTGPTPLLHYSSISIKSFRYR